MKKILKKDILIPAGTIFETAPSKTVRYGTDCFQCTIGLTKDSAGFFIYNIEKEDKEIHTWFEDSQENTKFHCVFCGKILSDKNLGFLYCEDCKTYFLPTEIEGNFIMKEIHKEN